MIDETVPSESKIFVLMIKDRPHRIALSPHGAQCFVTILPLTKYWSSREKRTISLSLWLLAAIRKGSRFVVVGSSEKVVSSLLWLNGLPLIPKKWVVYWRASRLLSSTSLLASSLIDSSSAVLESEDEKVSVTDGSSFNSSDGCCFGAGLESSDESLAN